jgi:thioredoxin 1
MAGDGLRSVASALREELLRIGSLIERYVSDPLVEVTASNVDEILKRYKVVILFFTAEWCGPCVSMQNALRDIASRVLRDDVVFGKVDVDRSYSVADRFNVQHIPAVLVIVKGSVDDVILGSTTREKLEERLRKYLA